MTRLPFELLLALRYVRPKRSFVSLVTFISVLGVTLGVAVLIVVISVFTGFEHKLREKILGLNPHLRVLQAGRTMDDYRNIAPLIAKNENVKAIAPFILGQVLVETKPRTGQPEDAAPWVRGLDPKLEGNSSSLAASTKIGKFDLAERGLVIGIELAKQLKVTVGDPLLVYSPADLVQWRKHAGDNNQKEPVPDEYHVRGIFDVGYFEYNRAFILTSLENAQRMYDLGHSVHGLLVAVKDPYQAEVVRDQLEQALGPGFQISTWKEESAQLLGAVVVARNIQFYLLFFIMIVAALCILSALITFVVQKTREIGMLKALGATDVQVATLFLSQSGFIGANGIAAGLGLGRLALAYRNGFLHLLNRTLRVELLAPSIYGFGELPALIVPRDVLLICGSAFVICILGGVIPAFMASRLKPIEALRHA
ncbi:MAG TPA: ABC transporter permease [Verrucomicrobiae bacterium]|nr:ABC transporter permease [Verrucomicrobiae bacterium]